MLSLFALALLTLGVQSITNTKVLREYDVKGNILFARYTISFIANEEDDVRDTYLFPLEFAMEHLSTISFSVAGNAIRAVYDESFVPISSLKSCHISLSFYRLKLVKMYIKFLFLLL